MTRREQARAFLAALHPAPSAERLIEFRALPPKRARAEPISFWYWDEGCRAVERAMELADAGYDLYVGVNPRRTMGGGRRENLHAVSALVVDVDEKKTGVRVADVAEQMRRAGLAPSLFVASGGGGHLYLLLDGYYPVDEAAAVAKRLCQSLPEADVAVSDPTRIMRLPGTWNWKTNPPEACFLGGDFGIRYTLGAVVAALDAVGAPHFEEVKAAPPVYGPISGSVMTLISKLPAYLRTAVETGQAPPGWMDMSELDFALMTNLAAVGATDSDVVAVYSTYRIPWTAGKSSAYFDRTLSRARAAATANAADRDINVSLLATGLFYEADDGTILPDMDACRDRVRSAWRLDVRRCETIAPIN